VVKKKQKRKNNPVNNEGKKITRKQNNEIYGILMLSIGVLVFLSFFFENSIGPTGIFIKRVLSGLMGAAGYLISPVIIVYSLILIFGKSQKGIRTKILYILLLFSFISSFIQTAKYIPQDYINMNPLQCIAKFYNDGHALSGGGVLGGIISMPLLKAVKIPGTIIILTAVSLIDVILLTNISLAELFVKFKNIISSIIKTIYTLVLKIVKGNKAAKKKNNTEIIDNDMDVIVENPVECPVETPDRIKPRIIDFRIEKEARSKTNDTEVKIEKQNKADAVKIEKVSNEEKSKRKNSSIGQTNIPEEKVLRSEDAVFEYRFPPLNLLRKNKDITSIKGYRTRAIERARLLEQTLKSFGVTARVINICRGPAVTRYELQPSAGVKVSKIVNLSDDIALNLASSGVRIEAPIPGKAAVGIEVPNKEITPVLLREVIESGEFEKSESRLAIALGKDITGKCIVTDIGMMPHLLIAGATGAGKSVCINSLIISLLYKSSPEEVKLIMIDPKVVELGVYNGIPHLMIPVVTDPAKAAGALNWAVQEMVRRYKKFADKGVRDITGYNTLISTQGPAEELMPQIVIIIDELSDLMMAAPNDVEDAICRIAQMARAAGMHLVIATQRPSVNVITGVIKANIPSRISFAVSSQVDSRTILDMGGAEKLLGRGDMLFNPVGNQKPVRIQGAFVTNDEVERVVKYIKSQYETEYDDDLIEEITSEIVHDKGKNSERDELLPDAIETVIEAGQASVSLIQRRYKVGYARAARIVDQMEARGIIGEFEGSKPRRLLISKQQWQEIKHRDFE
jgi:DNA segregation ATPase FtsK/SpoIIIE, S-DNA-T family